MKDDGITITVNPEKIKSVAKVVTSLVVFAGVGVLCREGSKTLSSSLKCSLVDRKLAEFALFGISCALGELATSYFDNVIDDTVNLTTAFATIFEDEE
jgi:hypothetical protein